MESFVAIFERAIERKGSRQKVNALLPDIKTPAQLAALPDSEYLAAMSKKVFQSGFVWRVVENKWPGFEEVLWGFEPAKLSLASDEQIEQMAQDRRIIRNLTKVKSVRENAFFIRRIAALNSTFKSSKSAKSQGFGQFIADWPIENITGLWLKLKKEGCRLGGNTGPYFLRAVGKDTFLMTRDVVAYLKGQNVITRQPSSQRDLKAVQQVFNDWQQESGQSMAVISRVISLSIGENLLED